MANQNKGICICLGVNQGSEIVGFVVLTPGIGGSVQPGNRER